MTVEPGQVLAYAVVVFIGAISPGADFAIVSRHASLHGRAAGLAAAAGIAGGLAVNATAALLGLAAVLLASPTLYIAIKLVGAAYLLYLGVAASWRLRPRARIGPADPDSAGAASAPRSAEFDSPLQPDGAAPLAEPGSVRSSTVWSAFRQALLTNLLNPKPIVFLVTLIPQFLPTDPNVLSRVILGVVTVLAAFVWFAIVAFVFSAFARFFAIPRVAFVVGLATGLMLIAIGVTFMVTTLTELATS